MKNMNYNKISISRRLGILAFIVIAGAFMTFCTNKRSESEENKENGTARKKDDVLKVFMLWDMEGASGLFEKEKIWYWDPGVPEQMGKEGCELLTADVNSAARAAFEAGVDSLIICDTHHGGNNIIPEKLISNPRIKFLPRNVGLENGKWRWMPGLNETVDGFMVMAHHAKAGTEGAFLHHAQSLAWTDVRINGKSVGEIGIESCYAGNWDIPVIMMHGDEAGCREAEELLPGIVTAAVKHAVSYDKAEGPDAEAARDLTARKVKEAIDKLKSGGKFTIYKPTLPMTVSVRLKTMEAAEKLSERFGATLKDPYTVEETIDRQCDVMKLFTGAGLDMLDPAKR
ncbi:M55 family metallopeptidase [Bacteroidota bacterium]